MGVTGHCWVRLQFITDGITQCLSQAASSGPAAPNRYSPMVPVSETCRRHILTTWRMDGDASGAIDLVYHLSEHSFKQRIGSARSGGIFDRKESARLSSVHRRSLLRLENIRNNMKFLFAPDPALRRSALVRQRSGTAGQNKTRVTCRLTQE